MDKSNDLTVRLSLDSRGKGKIDADSNLNSEVEGQFFEHNWGLTRCWSIQPESTHLYHSADIRMISKLAMLDKHNGEQEEPAWPLPGKGVRQVDKTLNAPVEEGDEYIYCAN